MKQINTIFTFNNGIPIGVTAMVGDKQYTADSTHSNWEAILSAIRADNVKAFESAIDIKSAFQNYTVGKVRIVGGEVLYGDTRLGGVVVDRIFDFMANNLPVEPIMLFIGKLFQNPSSRAVNELYRFLEHENLPITATGNFRAYKGLKNDFYSVTSGNLTLLQGKTDGHGHIYNGVGETIECVRHQVNDDKDQTCSYGLHAGSLEYAKNFAQGKFVIVEIDPKDVVSIPSDCNGEKLRTCKYVVVEEYVAPLDSVYIKPTTSFNSNPVDTDKSESCDNGCDCGCELEDFDLDDSYEAALDIGAQAGYDDSLANRMYNPLGNASIKHALETGKIVDEVLEEFKTGLFDGYKKGYNEGSKGSGK